MLALRVDEPRVGFDTFDVAEYCKPVKEETIAATHVQDAKPLLRRYVPAQNV
jgi:hypothetical protein